MEIEWDLTILILKNTFLEILFTPMHGYQYFILFSEKLVLCLNLTNNKKI